MSRSQREIVRGYCWTATGLGVVLGPGIDAAPLAGLWAAGFLHLAKDGDVTVDKTEVKAAIATIIVAFGAWFVSGKIAQIVAGALATAAAAGIFASGGLSILLGVLATLGLNATINALFTYRFLTASAEIINDANEAGTIFLNAFINILTNQLKSIAEIPADLAKTARIMVSG